VKLSCTDLGLNQSSPQTQIPEQCQVMCQKHNLHWAHQWVRNHLGQTVCKCCIRYPVNQDEKDVWSSQSQMTPRESHREFLTKELQINR